MVDYTDGRFSFGCLYLCVLALPKSPVSFEKLRTNTFRRTKQYNSRRWIQIWQIRFVELSVHCVTTTSGTFQTNRVQTFGGGAGTVKVHIIGVNTPFYYALHKWMVHVGSISVRVIRRWMHVGINRYRVMHDERTVDHCTGAHYLGSRFRSLAPVSCTIDACA